MAKWEPAVAESLQYEYDEWHIAPAVKAGPLVICSGAIGVQADGSVPDDPATQFEVLFRNMEVALEGAGASFEDVCELLSFHVGLDHLDVLREVKERFIPGPHPAWTAIGVAELGGSTLPGLLAEIRVTAYTG
jgi:enamine deaminase RidA (YjgF/YER057c/UK114 family)